MRRRSAVTTALLVAALLPVGCGGGEDRPEDRPAARQDAGTLAVTTRAAELRAALAGSLVDNAYRQALLATTGVAAGFGTPDAQAAAASLDRTARRAARAVAGAAGERAGEQLLGLLRDQAAMLTDLARATQARDAPARETALADLSGARDDLGALVEGLAPGLPAGEVTRLLRPQTAGLVRVVDDATAGRPTVFLAVRRAAQPAERLAARLSAGLAAAKPDAVPGDPDGRASALRAAFTAELVGHAHLAAIALAQELRTGPGSVSAKAATRAWDAQARRLARQLRDVYGREASDEFLLLWRDHLEVLRDYARGALERSAARKQGALDDLGPLAREIGVFVEGLNPNLPAGAVAAEVRREDAGLTAVVRAAAARSPKVHARISDVAEGMPRTARVLAAGIVQQYRSRFGAS